MLTGWLDQIGSKIIYERKSQPVLYVIPTTSILGRLPLVPVGDNGTIPYSMPVRSESADIPGGGCDSRPSSCDGSRWWYVNTWALGWASEP